MILLYLLSYNSVSFLFHNLIMNVIEQDKKTPRPTMPSRGVCAKLQVANRKII